VPAGDTSHCVDGRQFSPTIDFYAPPCVPKSNGRNPGATYLGVTASQITVVDYYPEGNAAVDDSEKAQGLYVSIQQQQQWDSAAADFINSHYELYGRRLKIVVVQGTCSTIPPDTACLRSEMRSITAQYKPYLFRWISPLTSAPFDELSSLGVVNVGGIMFTDSFSTARAPYHWDLNMSGTKIAAEFAGWWCNQMSAQPAGYSAAPTAAGNTDGQKRILGVVGTNDPENILMREELDQDLRAGCGDHVYHTYDASNDLSTAAEQMQASVAAMRQNPPSTTVLCLCNPVGAEFVYNEMQQQQYYPEIVYAGTVYTDLDDAGQAMMSGSACPSGRACTFAKAFGLQTSDPRQPVGHDTAQRVWTASGRTGAAPFSGAELDWEYWNMVATLLEGAGPDLTPANMAQGAFATPPVGGGSTGHPLRAFSRSSYAWTQDARLTYWDPTRTSSFNQKTGTYLPVTGWTDAGSWPKGLRGVPVTRS
ncbi:MAG TPA: hypothetical protein VFH70_09925, partial [Acidimicrobiales bacterium]|nr:hypothetical protein [Acidimicrobiales bacterium]